MQTRRDGPGGRSAVDVVKPLRALIVTHRPDDAELVLAELRRGPFEPHWARVETASGLRAALAEPWDVILSDVTLPAFGAIQALEILRTSGLDIPLLVVAGTIGEEGAAEVIRSGARDYILEGNLTRLVPAVVRELREAETRSARGRLEGTAHALAAVVESASDPIISEALDGTITSWNAAAERLYGWTAREAIGRHISFTFPPDCAPDIPAMLSRLRRGELIPPFETVRLHKDGRRVDVEVTVSPVLDRDGRLKGLSKIVRDVREKKRLEAAAREHAVALRESEERHRRLIETIPHMVWTTGADGSVEYLNGRGAETLGIPPTAIQGKGWLSLVHPGEAAAVGDAWDAAVLKGAPCRNEYRLRQPDGSYRWYLSQGVPVRWPDGTLEKWVGTWTDIHDMKIAEDGLARDALLLASVRDALIVTNLDGIVTYWNDGATRLFGWTAGERLGRPLIERFPEEARETVARLTRDIADGRDWGGEFHDSRKDGSRVWIDATVVCIRDAAGHPISVMGISQDISLRKEAEEALRASEERFRQIAENIREVFWITDPARKKIDYVSPAYEAIWGRPAARLYADPGEWADAVHPDDREHAVDAALTKASTGEYDEEYRIVRPDGVVRWVRDRAFPVRGADGRVERVVGVAEDITARRVLEEQLRQAQKMEAIGQLAGGVAHDFNNLLTVISGCSDLLLDTLAPDAPECELVQEIRKAGDRSAALTRQLLAFSRKGVLAPKVLDLNDIVRDTDKMLRRVIGEDIRLVTALSSKLDSVMADPSQMEQVLLNLAVNARDAMPEGGTLTIETRNVKAGDRQALADIQEPCIVLSVSDTGVGMSEEVRQHVFEPFFTTKGPGKGTGLGLAVVHGIVQQSNGQIEVETGSGAGTVFRIFLPSAELKPPPVEAAQSASATPRGTETILLVEDEDAVRELARRILQGYGYTVLPAANAGEALRLCGTHAGHIDILVTDVVMPGVNGRVLAERLQAEHPHMKVLYVSGYTDDAVVRHGIVQDDAGYLQKPFTPHMLATKVREALAG
ncbi:PAS domain-containing protein [soil metagenome]